MKTNFLVISLLILCLDLARAGDFYVDAKKGSNTTGDGSKEKPWFTISFALAKITGSGHTLHVAPGTYDTVMDGVFPEIFPLLIRSGISLIGAGADSTIIDAKGSNTVMRFENTGSAQIKIEGFTIRNGKSSGTGGLYVFNSNVIIQNNVFDRNTEGGAIDLRGGTVTIDRNSFTNNHTSGGGSEGYGGAINITGGTVTMTRNSFNTNRSVFRGGAIAMSSGTVFVNQNEFIGNTANFFGAAFYGEISVNANVEISENVFRANGGGEDIYIGSFSSQSSLSPQISRNIITSALLR
jgi:hypothetical protein